MGKQAGSARPKEASGAILMLNPLKEETEIILGHAEHSLWALLVTSPQVGLVTM